MNRRFIAFLVLASAISQSVLSLGAADASTNQPVIRHSYFVLGSKTAIIGESGQAEWEYRGGSRDGFILPNGNALITWADAVEEVTRDRRVVFSYRRSAENGEMSTAQRLYNGNTLINVQQGFNSNDKIDLFSLAVDFVF